MKDARDQIQYYIIDTMDDHLQNNAAENVDDACVDKIDDGFDKIWVVITELSGDIQKIVRISIQEE